MKFRAKEPAWYNLLYLTKGMEFDAPEDFDAPWAECLAEKREDPFHVPSDDKTAQEETEETAEQEPSKPAKKPRIQRKPTTKGTTVE